LELVLYFYQKLSIYKYTLIGTAQTQKNRPKQVEILNFPQILNRKGDILGVLYGTPCDTKSLQELWCSWKTKKTPPSMLLDEPTILNKEQIGQCSEAQNFVRDPKRKPRILLVANTR